jgi:hypothetical protein
MARGGNNRVLGMVGKTFGELTVLRSAERNSSGKLCWVCMCTCGDECVISGAHLRNGHTKTCGHPPTHCSHGHLRSLENTYPDGTCRVCQKDRRSSAEYREKRNEEDRAYYTKTKPEYLRKTRERMASLKLEVLTNYSPEHTLGCCWEDCTVTDIDILSLDHVNNDGAEHRRALGWGHTGGEKLYRLVKNAGYPDGFQTLCMNHQTKKHLLNVRSKYA